MYLYFKCYLLTFYLFGFLITILNAQYYDKYWNNASPHKNVSYRTYSKSLSRWKTFYYNDDDDTDDKPNFVPDQFPFYPGMWHQNKSPKLSTPEQCARHCKVGARPRICYYHWTFEYYRTLGAACQLCAPITMRSTSNCQCILADGVDLSGIIVANRMFPGPAIQVCLGDIVVVDVTNNVAGNGLSIHWHGIYQEDWQHYDGVPFVTQCPIVTGTTFRYQWRAQNPGSHFWHAHSGLHKADGVDGPIVIREPLPDYSNRKPYDDDDLDNIIFISDWLHDGAASHFPGTTTKKVGQVPDNFLINGRGQWTDPNTGNSTTTPLTYINVRPGIRYRLRIINACSLGCPVQLIIQDHNLVIIAVDGEDVMPQPVTTITIYAAERVDVVLNANQPVGTYWIQVRGLKACADQNIQQFAILSYNGSELATPRLEKPLYNPGLPRGIIFNEIDEICNGTRKDTVCIADLKSFEPVHERILESYSDIQVLLPFNFYNFNNTELFATQRYQRFFVPDGESYLAGTLGEISYTSPSSPLISQFNNIPKDHICNQNNIPYHCKSSRPCYCTHLIYVPLNAVVDIIMVDGGPNGISHPFHLHGYGFHVLAQGLLSRVNFTQTNKKWALQMHRQEYGSLNNRPPTKDTLPVATGGYTIVRFIANNPGYWFYHCHFLQHLYGGMSVVFKVGEGDDLPPTPKHFPKCGNFMPEFSKFNPKPRRQNFQVEPGINDQLAAGQTFEHQYSPNTDWGYG